MGKNHPGEKGGGEELKEDIPRTASQWVNNIEGSTRGEGRSGGGERRKNAIDITWSAGVRKEEVSKRGFWENVNSQKKRQNGPRDSGKKTVSHYEGGTPAQNTSGGIRSLRNRRGAEERKTL